MLKVSNVLIALCVVGLVVLAPRPSSADEAPGVPPEDGGEPPIKYFPALENGVPGSYGVELYSSASASDTPELVAGVGGTLGYIYHFVLNGFQAEMTAEQAELLSEDERVMSVQQETFQENEASSTLPYCCTGFVTNTRPFPNLPPPAGPAEVQTVSCVNPVPPGGISTCADNWGLDRIDRDLTSSTTRDGSYSYQQDGTLARVYTIDTGILDANREFADAAGTGFRVDGGYDALCSTFPVCPGGNQPCSPTYAGQGHGTHVAAIIGGRTFGVAHNVLITPIKAICDTVTYTSAQYKIGLDLVLYDHLVTDPMAILNISGFNLFGACEYQPTNVSCSHQTAHAITTVAHRDNILMVQSAGNNSNSSLADACDHSFGAEGRYPTTDPDGPGPLISDSAAMARILIAAGSNESDGLWRDLSATPQIGSSVGSCVDIFAPASNIVSAFNPVNPSPYPNGNEVVCQLSGTSMAAPHVSGVAALVVQNFPGITPEALKALILNFGEQGALDSSGGSYDIGPDSPNLLLHWEPSYIAKDGFETNDLRFWIVY